MSELPSQRPGRRERLAFLSPSLIGVVFAGGMIGTLFRYLLEATWPTVPGTWPVTTFAINVVGSYALGLVTALMARLGPDTGWRRRGRLGLGTGVIGGFTTYSAFVVEAVDLLDLGTPKTTTLAALYVVVSVLLTAAAAALGMATVRRFWRPAQRDAGGERS